MFARTTSLFERIPTEGFLEQIKFWFLNRKLESTAKEYGLALNEEFYAELTKWTGKDAVIVFSKKNDDPVKWTIETRDEHFARMLKRADTCGVASSVL